MLIDCDKNMIVHLLRNWHPNRLRPQGVRLAKERPRLMTLQNSVCPLCPERPEPLVNDGKVTHIDHIVTVKEFSVKVLQGELTFDDAYASCGKIQIFVPFIANAITTETLMRPKRKL
jgi:hypothetical protein